MHFSVPNSKFSAYEFLYKAIKDELIKRGHWLISLEIGTELTKNGEWLSEISSFEFPFKMKNKKGEEVRGRATLSFVVKKLNFDRSHDFAVHGNVVIEITQILSATVLTKMLAEEKKCIAAKRNIKKKGKRGKKRSE